MIACLEDNWAYERQGSQQPALSSSWFSGGYATTVLPQESKTYRAWVAEVVARYAGDPRIAVWELVNEGNAMTQGFASDVSGLIKSLDSLTPVGCGGVGGGFPGLATIDVVGYHYYTNYGQTGWQSTQQAAAAAGKPWYIGECGFSPSGSRPQEFQSLLSSVFNASNSAGFVAWQFANQGGDGFDIGTGDPAQTWHDGVVVQRKTPGQQTIFITGATDGLGRALAHRLAAAGHAVLLHGRDQQKLDGTAAEIASQHGVSKPRTFRADLASLAEVRRLADDVLAATGRLDVFVSNAGIGFGEPDGRERRTSADGYELRFAVNYLAGFLLTARLLPLLQQQSASARIVNVASLGQAPLDFDDLMLERDYSGIRAYCQSKLAQIMSGFELACRLPDGQVTVNSLHPATFMPTKMVLAERTSVDTLEDGVDSTERLVIDPALAGVTGRFFDHTREATADAQAYDTDARARLWAVSEQLTNLPG